VKFAENSLSSLFSQGKRLMKNSPNTCPAYLTHWELNINIKIAVNNEDKQIV
jgi:hypothetical protein